jgi:hypothetical protein
MRSIVGLRIGIVVVALWLLMPFTASAQSGQLVGYAALPAGTVTDGAPAGQALGGAVNGISLPFSSQPFGSVTGITAGDYPGYWLVLTSGTFQAPDRSADFLLRIYTVETDLRRADGGGGSALPVAWITLSDPRKFLGDGIALAKTRTRSLTGADVTPRAFVRMGDGTFWVADGRAGQLLRFDGQGKLIAAPTPLNGAISGLSITPDGGTLVVMLGNDITLLDPNSGAETGRLAAYGPDGGSRVGGLTMINGGEALVVEGDGGEGGGANSKKVYLVNITNGSKQLLVDLLAIDDPNGLAGQGSPFRFPYADINAVYPIDGSTLIVVNNNRVPFGQARQPGVADPTEYIAVRTTVGLNVDGSLLRR